MDIVITEFTNRRNPVGTVVKTTWDDFVDRLRHPVWTDDTLDDYAAMTNEQRTEVKDVGGYVAGEFENGKRQKNLLKSRYVLTIDADDATPHDVDDYEFYDEPWMFCVHSTHTSTEANPRLRWLFLLSRPVVPEEYRPLVRYVSSFVGADTIDETTDQPERLMFWPSVSLDADYFFKTGGVEPIDVDSILDNFDLEEAEEPEEIDISESFFKSGVVMEGSRDNTTYRIACKLRQIGFDDDLILSTIKEFNKTYCQPKLPAKDIKRIVTSACKFSPGELFQISDMSMKDSFGDIGDVQELKEKPIETGTQLMKRHIDPSEYFVEDMVTSGMGLIVAPPKFGKSWFALDLAVSVATGTEFFGKKTKKSGVLYYALEDNDRRLQRRLGQVAGDRTDLDLFFHTETAPTIENGLFDEIDKHLREHPEIKLVVIDTLQKVRGMARKTEGAYGYDYRELGDFQKFAFANDISICLVHHTRKIIDKNDLIGNVSGTNGVSGAADYVFGMSKTKWNDDQAKLELTGRDVEPQSYIMVFRNYRWECLGKEREVRESEEQDSYSRDPVVNTILEQLRFVEASTEDDPAEWIVTNSDLLKYVNSNGAGFNTTNKLAYHLVKLEPFLASKDGITFSKRHYSNGDFNVFSRYRM